MKELIDFPYSNVLVLGLAKSGTAVAKLLLKSGKKVRVNDKQVNELIDLVTELKSMGADVVIGSHPLSVLEDIEIIVKNPGIPYDNPVIKEAIQRNIPIITEIEIAGLLADGPIIGITGSNGKTTTTMLTYEMLAENDQHVKVAGNIGIVATEVTQTMKKNDQMILELSSFQLLGIQKFKPKIAVLLNIYEAHLDYHKTIENYEQAKFNVFSNQTSDDFLVYNADDKTLVNAVKNAKSTLVPFSVKKQVHNGAWVDKESVYFKSEKIIDKKEIVLVGEHNLANILAAISAAKLSGAKNEFIQKVLTTFSGVKHRLQFVKRVKNRIFYNDSKATNILATQKALLSFSQPIILLAGGLDRGNGFNSLLPYLEYVKAMIVFGETAEKLQQIAHKAGIETITIVKSMDEAVEQAYSQSSTGDVILLSPACASWDQYRTFEERGDMFINKVHTLV